MSTPPAPPTQSELERAGAIEIMSNELGELKCLLDHQEQETKLMRAQPNATKSTSTATETEAKDLLRKVRFDGKNFSTFKANFEGVCRLRYIWFIISGTETLDDSATQEQLAEFSDKKNLAKSYLQTSVSDVVFDMVRKDMTPAEM
ncbi:hypothetical protein LEN26_016063 [Aphanomyces euteiches]|nr:hypothetical protein LEN26_016063 [Aphanomyces euteiches]KAH9124699.1 hypothetical protein AeMF1_004574 [Aphanomyces euteiches]KAH9181677.1 hypothetical protein AeNC1_016348 [Aphanomyces euteiches]